jgi:NADH:ubiquinone oxidoreductase subunit E
MPETRPKIRVCHHDECLRGGGQKVFDALSTAFADKADVEASPDCFRFCKLGPNVTVNGAVLHHIRADSAVGRVRRELAGPRAKKDVVGSRPIDELDDVLDELSHL